MNTNCLVVVSRSEFGEMVWGVFPEKRKKQADAYMVQCSRRMIEDDDYGRHQEFLVIPGTLSRHLGLLRTRVFIRDRYRCVKCSGEVTWDGPRSGHLHEKQSRGKQGYRTMDNCETLCSSCHVGILGEHGLSRKKVTWHFKIDDLDEVPF